MQNFIFSTKNTAVFFLYILVTPRFLIEIIIMKKILIPVFLVLPSFLFAQNLTWEQKISPEYSYKLPQKEKKETNSLCTTKRSATGAGNLYNKLLLKRDELKANIVDLKKNQNTEKDKQWLDKYRVSLKFVEDKILKYQNPKKKEK